MGNLLSPVFFGVVGVGLIIKAIDLIVSGNWPAALVFGFVGIGLLNSFLENRES